MENEIQKRKSRPESKWIKLSVISTKSKIENETKKENDAMVFMRIE